MNDGEDQELAIGYTRDISTLFRSLSISGTAFRRIMIINSYERCRSIVSTQLFSIVYSFGLLGPHLLHLV
jgi:hypothetical protein